MVNRRAAVLLAILASCGAVGEEVDQDGSALVRVVGVDGTAAPSFAADAGAILAELEAWRGLPFTEDLVVEMVTPEQAGDDKLNGWYEPDTKRLVVVEGKTDRMGRGVLLHEMFHALQDQHFDLGALHRDAAAQGEDAERALQALIEGEAMLAVSEILDYDFERHAHLPESGPISADRFAKLFHYGEGLRFVRALRERGGWAQVDAAFAAPPRTTAEIYSPQMYPRRETAAPETERGEFTLRHWLAEDEALRSELPSFMDALLDEELDAGGVWRLSFSSEGLAGAVAESARGRGLEASLDEGGMSVRIELAQ